MRSFFASLALVAGLFATIAAQPALAQGAVKSTHGDWQLLCDTPPGAQAERCFLRQNVAAEDRPNVALTVIVLKMADTKATHLRVLAPLGVLLPFGLGLKVDNADVGRVGFARCMPSGCLADVAMDDALLGKFMTGQNALFVIADTAEEGIGVPVSLNGFKEGFAKLP
jgi:invasion protein IalB